MRIVAAGILLVVVGCSDRPAAAPAAFPIRVVVTNALVAPVTLAVDGTPALGLTAGRSSGLTVSSTARWLTWTSAKPMDAAGQPIADDIGEVRLPVSSLGAELEITNVVEDRTYVTARFFNLTSAAAAIGVVAAGATVACAGVLPPATPRTLGYTQIGYYRLLPGTEVRAYRDGARCAGPYVAWPASELAAYEKRSGLVTLVLDSAMVR